MTGLYKQKYGGKEAGWVRKILLVRSEFQKYKLSNKTAREMFTIALDFANPVRKKVQER